MIKDFRFDAAPFFSRLSPGLFWKKIETTTTTP